MSLSTRAKKAKFRAPSGPTKKPKGLLRRSRRVKDLGDAPTGRPGKWHRVKTMRYVCERMVKGELLGMILKRIGLDRGAITVWMQNDKTGQLAQAFQQSKELQADAIAERALRITQGKDGRGKSVRAEKKRLRLDPNGAQKIRQLDTVRVARNRLELDGIKWYVGKQHPRKYGDKVDVTTGGDKLPASGAPQSLTVKFVNAKDGVKVETA